MNMKPKPGFRQSVSARARYGRGSRLSDKTQFRDNLGKAHAVVAPPPSLGQLHIGRNDPCPCGSGKKFKKCCYAQ